MLINDPQVHIRAASTRLPCTYRQGITLFTEELAWLGPEGREWIMGRGVCEWLGWKL